MIAPSDKVAIITQNERITYNQLLCGARFYCCVFAEYLSYSADYDCPADAFRDAPPTETPKILILSENSPAFAYSLIGAWKAGCIAVPMDASATPAEMAYVIDDCRPAVVAASHTKMPLALEATGQSDHKPSLVNISLTEVGANNFTQHSPECDKCPPEFKPVHKKCALIVYTSGTTGSPKGVMLSFGNILSNLDAVCKHVRVFLPGSCTLCLLPLHHILPLQGSLLAPLYTGGSIAICPTMQAADLMRTLQENKVDIIIGVPRLYTTLAKGITDKINSKALTRLVYKTAEFFGNRSLSRFLFGSVRRRMGGAIRYMVCGGAALDSEVASALKTLGLDVLEGYGMSEAAPMISFTRPDDITPGCSGLPMPGTEIKIYDGEVFARGPGIMMGYYNREQETEDVLDKDGWLRTGDMGYLDRKGRLWITGRKKEIIVLSNGKNVNPNEIEYKLQCGGEHIKEVGVTTQGDALHAVVVPTPALAALDAEERDHRLRSEVFEPYNRNTSPYKKVMGWTVVDGPLPRTKLDKLQRFKLRELVVAANATTDKPKTVEAELAPEMRMLLAHIKSEKGIDAKPTDHVELDLAMDSLDLVEMQVFVSQSFGVELKTEDISAYKSLAEMADDIARRKTRMETTEVDWEAILRQHTKVHLPSTWATGRLIVAAAKLFFGLYFKLTGKGSDNLPTEGPVIIASNHQSYLDGLFVMSFVKFRNIKNTYFYAKEKHVRQPLLRFIANRHNVIVVDVNNLKESIQKLGEALKKKKKLIIFPEGTRTANGQMGQFKKTFAILSKELKVPIVPVSIRGAFEAMPKGCWLPRPRKVEVEFLKPVFPDERKTYDELSQGVYDKILAAQK